MYKISFGLTAFDLLNVSEDTVNGTASILLRIGNDINSAIDGIKNGLSVIKVEDETGRKIQDLNGYDTFGNVVLMYDYPYDTGKTDTCASITIQRSNENQLTTMANDVATANAAIAEVYDSTAEDLKTVNEAVAELYDLVMGTNEEETA